MKNVIKFLGMFVAAATLFTACQKEELEVPETGVASKMAVIDLGLPGGADQVDAEGNVFVNRNLTLTAGNTYILHNYFRIQSGFTITIEPGVIIRGAQPNRSTSALVIERGARINAQGTVSQPIVFTSNATTPAPGDWGGVVILGNAPVNIAADPSTPGTSNGVGAIEGLPNPRNTGFYGGSNAADNSGTLRYVRIEYAGDIIGTDNELNGLTLGGVGNGTTLEFVQVSFGLDDGFEFFGGTVNGRYLVANRNGDDDFDTDQGYNGKLQFGLVVRDQNGSWLSSAPLNGSESNGDDDDSFRAGLTSAQFSNFTFVGPYINDCSGAVNGNYSSGIYFRDGSVQDIFNSVIIGFPNGIRIKDGVADFNTNTGVSANLIDVKNTTIIVPQISASSAVRATRDDQTNANFDNVFFAPALQNRIITATSCAVNAPTSMARAAGLSPNLWSGIQNRQPDVRILNNRGGLVGSTNFNGLSGFQTVNYRGAFATNGNWLNGWTNWQL